MAHSELYWSVYKANLLERIRTWTESNPGRLLEAFNDLAEPLKLQASLCKHIFGCHTSSSEASCFYYLYPRSPPSQSHFVLFPHWGTIWDRCYITREDAEHVEWTERKSFAVPRFPIKVSVPTYLISFEVELQKKKKSSSLSGIQVFYLIKAHKCAETYNTDVKPIRLHFTLWKQNAQMVASTSAYLK